MLQPHPNFSLLRATRVFARSDAPRTPRRPASQPPRGLRAPGKEARAASGSESNAEPRRWGVLNARPRTVSAWAEGRVTGARYGGKNEGEQHAGAEGNYPGKHAAARVEKSAARR